MNSGIVHTLNPGLSSVSTNYLPDFEPEMYNKVKHLAIAVLCIAVSYIGQFIVFSIGDNLTPSNFFFFTGSGTHFVL